MVVEADNYLRPLQTSIMNIYTVFESLVCCLKGVCAHPYTFTPAKLAPDMGSQGPLWSENDAIMACLRLLSTSDHFIYPYETYKKCLTIGMLSQGIMAAPIYLYTGQVGPIRGGF
jgi:hypothetical protein